MLHNAQFLYNIKQQNGDAEHAGSCDSASDVYLGCVPGLNLGRSV
jgi:hypothetical protein